MKNKNPTLPVERLGSYRLVYSECQKCYSDVKSTQEILFMLYCKLCGLWFSQELSYTKFLRISKIFQHVFGRTVSDSVLGMVFDDVVESQEEINFFTFEFALVSALSCLKLEKQVSIEEFCVLYLSSSSTITNTR